MWKSYYTPTSIDETLRLLAECQESARLIAGGTDILLELERELRPGVNTLIDISRVHGLDRIVQDGDTIRLGPLVTHNHVINSPLCVEQAFPLASACWSVGAPQIRNRGTVAGNLVTASPANDTITPLWAMDARVTLQSARRGQRTLAFPEFYQGVRRVDLAPDEMLVEISFPALQRNQCGSFLKLGLRQAQAIALVNVAVVLSFDESTITDARITLGSVGPTIVRAKDAESILVGRALDPITIQRAAELAATTAHPIDDVRGSAVYRRMMVEVYTRRTLLALSQGSERSNWPADPPMLWGKGNGRFPSLAGKTIVHREGRGEPIQAVINGQAMPVFGANGKTLLRMLREDLGLTGTKEGCTEGECGACSVIMDGAAVMSCLVAAPRAHGAEIITIEGLPDWGLPAGRASGQDEHAELHPIQQSFIEESAVQCGYCTPGLLISSASLLAEKTLPTEKQTKQALAGNLCRCTGYYSILRAVEKAAQKMSTS